MRGLSQAGVISGGWEQAGGPATGPRPGPRAATHRLPDPSGAPFPELEHPMVNKRIRPETSAWLC